MRRARHARVHGVLQCRRHRQGNGAAERDTSRSTPCNTKTAMSFALLADSTRRSYIPLIMRIEKSFSDFPVSSSHGSTHPWRLYGVARPTCFESAGRRQADYAWTVLARVLSWSLNRGLDRSQSLREGWATLSWLQGQTEDLDGRRRGRVSFNEPLSI